MRNDSYKTINYPWIVFFFVFILTACAPLISPYSLTAYQNATSLKATTLAEMDKATEPYSDHKIEIESLMLEVNKAYEFANGIPANEISATQWDILRKSDGNLLGKFARRWKEKGILSQIFIDDFKVNISDAFDAIICLEANKKEPTKCNNKGGK